MQVAAASVPRILCRPCPACNITLQEKCADGSLQEARRGDPFSEMRMTLLVGGKKMKGMSVSQSASMLPRVLIFPSPLPGLLR